MTVLVVMEYPITVQLLAVAGLLCVVQTKEVKKLIISELELLYPPPKKNV